MRIPLSNPNTSPAITGRVLAVAREVASPDAKLKGVTGRFGGRYIAGRATYAIAAHAALDALAGHRGRLMPSCSPAARPGCLCCRSSSQHRASATGLRPWWR